MRKGLFPYVIYEVLISRESCDPILELIHLTMCFELRLHRSEQKQLNTHINLKKKNVRWNSATAREEK